MELWLFVTWHRGATAGWGQSCPHGVAQTCPNRAWQQGRATPGATRKRGRCCPQPQLSVTPQHPVLIFRAMPVPGAVRVSVCVPGHAAAVPVRARVCLCHPLRAASVLSVFYPKKKTTLKGATAAQGHSWSPVATSGGGTLHPESSWPCHGRHRRESPLTCALSFPVCRR